MSGRVLDVGKLAEAVETIIRHRNISERTAAKEIGLSPSTLTRLKQGQKPNADGLVSLLAWLNADVSQFVTKVEARDE